jgi:dipeptidyl aminopeptidase/acylaminoacyl peptidase
MRTAKTLLYTFVLVCINIFHPSANAQIVRKNISPETYNIWNEISYRKISDHGKWVTYQKGPQQGDEYLMIYNNETATTDSILRGYAAALSSTGNFIAFRIKPEHEKVRKLKIAGKKEDQLPKDSVGIYHFTEKKIEKYAKLKQINVCEECAWMTLLLEEKPEEASKNKSGKKKSNNKSSSNKKSKKDAGKGNFLRVYHPADAKKTDYENVIEAVLSCESSRIAFVTHSIEKKTKKEKYNVNILNPVTGVKKTIASYDFEIKQLNISSKNGTLTYLATADTSKNKAYTLYVHSNPGESNEELTVIDSVTTGLPAGYSPSENGSISFSKDENKIFFGIAPKPVTPPKDTLPESEKPKLDIWSWHDDRIQSEQLSTVGRDKKNTFRTVLNLHDKSLLPLENDTLETVRVLLKGNSNLALGTTDIPYRIERTWTYPWKEDYYMIDITTGKRELILQGHAFNARISPAGKYLIWYDASDSTWYGKKSTDTGNARGVAISKNIKGSTAQWHNGSPALPEPHGIEGWTKDEEWVIIRTEFDLWACHPTAARECYNLTHGMGLKDSIRFTIISTDYEKEYINTDSTLLLHGFHHGNKDEGVYEWKPENKYLNELLKSNHRISGFTASKKGENIIFQKSNYYEYPDVWQSTKSFNDLRKLSKANPQQNEYAWGSVRPVEWKSKDGLKHSGLLYLPDMPPMPETTMVDYLMKYPMIVYYYEDYRDNLHNHYPPRPTASIVHPTEYVSNGYVIFIPDIYYVDPGSPGKSAYRSIMSGTDFILKTYPYLVDSTRMGLQGQSWGGYQTAFMITQTGRFRAAMAGAPVSNMTSAYGGIRWGSGLSRMFQYEKGQSRIGVTLWDSLGLYIENSPLFHLPKVSTPLLIMHNDEDDAVPWYQGIEMYMGLRRLQKPVWMLTYNNDKHNLMRRANRVDLSIRMMQFFNHYLKKEPMPRWMDEGLPAIKKGEELRYEIEGK